MYNYFQGVFINFLGQVRMLQLFIFKSWFFHCFVAYLNIDQWPLLQSKKPNLFHNEMTAFITWIIISHNFTQQSSIQNNKIHIIMHNLQAQNCSQLKFLK